jgi:fluoride ion exporter CrcB/FEX
MLTFKYPHYQIQNMITLVIGVIGLVGILSGFALNEFNIISRESYTYNIINLFGALMLGIYAYLLNNWIFVILEIVWIGITLYIMGKKYFKK